MALYSLIQFFSILILYNVSITFMYQSYTAKTDLTVNAVEGINSFHYLALVRKQSSALSYATQRVIFQGQGPEVP